MRWAVALLFTITIAVAQDHQHPPQDADLHDKFYATWQIPNNGHPRVYSCCNKKDCYPTVIKKIDGKWFARRREDGHWVHVTEDRLEQNQSDPRESPDWQSHACMGPPNSGNKVYCATLGSGS